jgi:hypothetical protein
MPRKKTVNSGHPTLNENGHEVLSSKPVAIPLKFRRPETLAETVRNMVLGEMSRQALNSGYESFAEADDFDVGDDFDPTSPYEMDFDTEVYRYDEPPRQKRTAQEERPVEEGLREKPNRVQSGRKKTPPDSEGPEPDQ